MKKEEKILERVAKVKKLIKEPRIDIAYFLGEVERLIACVEGTLENPVAEKNFFSLTQGGIEYGKETEEEKVKLLHEIGKEIMVIENQWQREREELVEDGINSMGDREDLELYNGREQAMAKVIAIIIRKISKLEGEQNENR